MRANKARTTASTLFIASLCSVIFSGCGGSGPENTSPAPYVDFECNSAQSHYCTQSAHLAPVLMGLSSESGFDCERELFQLDPRLFTPTFTYSGSVRAIFNGSFIIGAVTEWVNSSGGPALAMENGNYTLCAFLDLNENGSLDLIEPLATDTINPSQDFYPVSQWFHL